jgi:hypothetical protein
MIGEMGSMTFCLLREIATKEFFLKLNELMKQYEEDSEMTLLLTFFVEEVAYKGSIHPHIAGNTPPFVDNKKKGKKKTGIPFFCILPSHCFW